MNEKIFLNHNSICSLPWNGIFVNPDGKVKNCAISRTTLGNINSDSLDNILHGEANKAIRSDMLNNIRHSRCNACYSVEDNSPFKLNESNRSWYKQVAIKHSDLEIFDSADNFQPTILDLRWKNTCNFACVYCDPDLSSTWAAALKDNSYNVGDDYLSQAKNYIFKNIDKVKHVYLAGGEPLLMKDNVDLLDRLYSVNPDVEVRVNSNISNLNGPVFGQLKKFKNVKWTLSAESRDQHFKYMRWPGDWNTFVNNAITIQKIHGDQINFNMVWCILNPTEILSTIDYLLDQGFHENMFVVQCLTTPSPLSILHLPKDTIEQIRNQIKQRMQNANPDWWLYKSLASMLNFLNNPPPIFQKSSILKNGSEGIAGTIQFLTSVDNLRGTSSIELFNELYELAKTQ